LHIVDDIDDHKTRRKWSKGMKVETTRLASTIAGLAAALVATAAAAAAAAPNGGRCPTANLMAGRPPGPPPQVVLAKTVAASDTSTSLVITPDLARQIQCGKVALKTTEGVIFSKPKLADGRERPLAMDILTPAQGGRRPLVVYITGGGFMIAPRQSALDLRTYVAEAGFVVASIEYRTVPEGATWRDGLADVKAAIRYLKAHADIYGVDPEHVAVWAPWPG
jgi:acetyl esterase/lipase